jgi:hypothetical protein
MTYKGEGNINYISRTHTKNMGKYLDRDKCKLENEMEEAVNCS